MRRVISPLFLILSAGLFACDDPSDIGLGLVDPREHDTSVETIAPSFVSMEGPADVTGGDVLAGAVRVLSGQAEDDFAGSVRASGYFDVVPSGSFPSSHVNGTVTYIEVMLNVDYTFGREDVPLTLELSEISQTWTSAGRRADTTLAVSSPIMEIEVNPSEEDIRFSLPADWIAQHDALFRSSTFQDDFHGFRLSPVDGNAVIGFVPVTSGLRVSANPGDTLLFPLSKFVTGTEMSTPVEDTGYLVLRDGGTQSLRMGLDLDEQTLPPSAVHRAVIRLDSESFVLPDGFNSRELTQLELQIGTADGDHVIVATATLNDEGIISFDNDVISQLVQQRTLGKDAFEYLEIIIPATSSTVDYLLIKEGSPLDNGPRAFLTYTPLD